MQTRKKKEKKSEPWNYLEFHAYIPGFLKRWTNYRVTTYCLTIALAENKMQIFKTILQFVTFSKHQADKIQSSALILFNGLK